MLIPAEMLEDPARALILDQERLARDAGMPVSELRNGLVQAFFAPTAEHPGDLGR
jgi:hypothetical protein